MNALSELIHGLKMIFPQPIQYLQHDLLFDLTHGITNERAFFIIGGLHRSDNTLAQRLLVKIGVLPPTS